MRRDDPLILYHDNCPDGFTAAWVAWRTMGDKAEYRAVNYGQEAPIDAALGRHVYLVDFSFSREILDRLADSAASVTIFDHHKTAQADLDNWARGRVIFDMDRSGAGITWDELNPGGATWLGVRPQLISYVEDRDLWRWALPDSREISEFVFSVERTFKEWDQLAVGLEHYFEQIVEAGKALLRAKRVRVATICKNGVQWLMLGSHSIPIVNTAWDFSEIGEYLCEQFPDAPCGGY